MTLSHTEPSIGWILTSLLQLTPPTLSRSQISSNLATRHRLLGLPPMPPSVFDLDLDPSEQQQHYESDAREELGEWLVTRTHSDFSSEEVMGIFFDLRKEVRSSSDDIEARTVKRKTYSGNKIRLDLQGGITFLLSQQGDGTAFENMLPTSAISDQDHLWTDSIEPEEPTDTLGAAYINNADDFWDGFSDHGGAEPREVQQGKEQDEDDYWGSYGQEAVQDLNELKETNRSLRTKLWQIKGLLEAAKMEPKSEELEMTLQQMEMITLEGEGTQLY